MLTDYPNGITSFGVPVLGALGHDVTTGNIFFVDSGVGADTGSSGKDVESPFATIDYAVGKCTADNGDVIIVMPGHAENISTATSLVVDVDGIKILGVGHGLTKPKLTFTAAAGTISITGANVHFENFYLYANFATGITTGITLGAAADGAVLKNIRMEEAANTKEFLIGVSVTAACHNVLIDGFEFFGVTGGTDSQCIIFVGASNFSIVKNFKIYGDFSGAAIDALTAASTFMTISNGIVINDDVTAGLSVSVKSDTTGMMNDLRIGQLKDTVGPAGAAMCYGEVYVTNAVAVQGILKPAADT